MPRLDPPSQLTHYSPLSKTTRQRAQLNYDLRRFYSQFQRMESVAPTHPKLLPLKTKVLRTYFQSVNAYLARSLISQNSGRKVYNVNYGHETLDLANRQSWCLPPRIFTPLDFHHETLGFDGPDWLPRDFTVPGFFAFDTTYNGARDLVHLYALCDTGSAHRMLLIASDRSAGRLDFLASRDHFGSLVNQADLRIQGPHQILSWHLSNKAIA